ncbi:VanZ family protein [Sporosarcina highlanderae]|uniref:VanZ family protein n=1 Tax=Sporosarcina highlanderae TaxID=3035916 RepID=A0ABT8JSY8_9BACL|nr:VanZ family protein [Sporosarcina highlanderae]MDN4608017.1 VanZ family protein [Sporosarcina highlanderae]
MKKIVAFLIIVGILFISSGQTYEQQSLIPTLKTWLPNQPMYSLLDKLQIPYWGRIISIEERGYYHFVEFLLRKSAHFLIFGCLSIVIYWMLSKRVRRMPRFFLSLIFTAIVAALDEYHQSLTGGRTPTMQDVFLDVSGAFTFLILAQIIMMIKGKWKKHRMITP